MFGFGLKSLLHVCPSCKATKYCYAGSAEHCDPCLQSTESSVELIPMTEFARRAAAANPDKVHKHYWEADQGG